MKRKEERSRDVWKKIELDKKIERHIRRECSGITETMLHFRYRNQERIPIAFADCSPGDY